MHTETLKQRIIEELKESPRLSLSTHQIANRILTVETVAYVVQPGDRQIKRVYGILLRLAKKGIVCRFDGRGGYWGIKIKDDE